MTFTPLLGAIARFRLDRSLPKDDPSRRLAAWRGAIASRFGDDSAFHGHGVDGLRYRYPPVLYRWDEHGPSLVVIGDAVEAAMKHPWPGASLRIGAHVVSVVDVEWIPRSFSPAPSDRLLRYTFQSPWVALNQENQKTYRDSDDAGQRALLDAILVGNVLSMFKSLGWYLAPDQRILASFEPSEVVTVRLKDVSLLGFYGTLLSNWELPGDLALGRSVSRGFGVYAPVKGRGQQPSSP